MSVLPILYFQQIANMSYLSKAMMFLWFLQICWTDRMLYFFDQGLC